MVNHAKTALLMAGLMVLLMVLAELMHVPLVYALLFGGLLELLMFWFSDKIVLMMYRAQEVGPSQAPDLYRIVQNLARQANLPMPKVYIIPSPTPNAFATGRSPSHAAVAVTEGILHILNRDELEGVIAHELTHIRNRDTLISVIASVMVGAVWMVARMGQWMMFFGGLGRSDEGEDGRGNPLGAIVLLIMLIIAPIAALLLHFAISRSREFAADEGAAHISRKPLALANALAKLEMQNRQMPLMGADPATAHLFIVNPLRGEGLMTLLSTHPPILERIAKLKEIARQMGQIA